MGSHATAVAVNVKSFSQPSSQTTLRKTLDRDPFSYTRDFKADSPVTQILHTITRYYYTYLVFFNFCALD